MNSSLKRFRYLIRILHGARTYFVMWFSCRCAMPFPGMHSMTTNVFNAIKSTKVRQEGIISIHLFKYPLILCSEDFHLLISKALMLFLRFNHVAKRHFLEALKCPIEGCHYQAQIIDEVSFLFKFHSYLSTHSIWLAVDCYDILTGLATSQGKAQSQERSEISSIRHFPGEF